MISKHDIMYQLYPDATGCRTNADETLTAYKGQDELTIDQDAINNEYT